MTRIATAMAVACGLATIAVPQARATVTYTLSGPVSAYPGQPGANVVVDDFNGAIGSGVTIVAYSNDTFTPCAPGSAGCAATYVTPAQDAGVPAGTPPGRLSLAVGPGGGGVGFTTINFSSLNLDSVSFYWGSIDNWNEVQLLDPSGNVVAGSPVTGTSAITEACATDPTGPVVVCNQGYFNHGGSQLLTYSWDPATDDVASIEFVDSPYPYFEIGDVVGISTNVTAVPEPSSWPILLVGAVLTLVSAPVLAHRRRG